MSQATISLTSIYANKASRVLTIVGASLFIALCAQIKIPLFFTPVPLTLHAFAVMLMGALLGSRMGALAVVAYLTEIACGLPFMANGGAGVTSLVGPTGGYLVGFILQAYLVGLYCERTQSQRSFLSTVCVLALICVMQLGLGSLWLTNFVGIQNALTLGVYPFLAGDLLKSMVVASFLQLKMKAN